MKRLTSLNNGSKKERVTMRLLKVLMLVAAVMLVGVVAQAQTSEDVIGPVPDPTEASIKLTEAMVLPINKECEWIEIINDGAVAVKAAEMDFKTRLGSFRPEPIKELVVGDLIVGRDYLGPDERAVLLTRRTIDCIEKDVVGEEYAKTVGFIVGDGFNIGGLPSFPFEINVYVAQQLTDAVTTLEAKDYGISLNFNRTFGTHFSYWMCETLDCQHSLALETQYTDSLNQGVLDMVNTLTVEEMNDNGLPLKIAEAILKIRPIDNLEQLGAIPDMTYKYWSALYAYASAHAIDMLATKVAPQKVKLDSQGLVTGWLEVGDAICDLESAVVDACGEMRKVEAHVRTGGGEIMFKFDRQLLFKCGPKVYMEIKCDKGNFGGLFEYVIN